MYVYTPLSLSLYTQIRFLTFLLQSVQEENETQSVPILEKIEKNGKKKKQSECLYAVMAL